MRRVAADGRKPAGRKLRMIDHNGAFVLDPDGHNIETVCHAAA